MGVKNLWEILESCKKIHPLDHLQNKRVCIDLSCWIVQLQKVNKSRSVISIQDKLYLRGLFHRLRALIALNCNVIFVTDGSIPAIKLPTYRQRLNSALEVVTDGANLQEEACSLRRNTGSEFSRMVKEAKLLGSALGIPCLDSIEEAEAQCALLNAECLCDGCFTSDSDVFLFGAKTVYRDICLGEGGHVVCYEMEDIEKKLGFGRNSLITLALLLGSDYSQGVRGLGPESACQIIKSIGDQNVLQQIASEGPSFAKKTKASKKQTQLKPLEAEFIVDGTDQNAERQNQFLQVINAYLKPKCHSADSDAVHKVLASQSFQRAKLHQICAQLLGWPPEKTDEYILPKIAERDLRRFANFRSTSSEQGVNPSLAEKPVTCPVAGIVKRKKVQGREYFEVLWEGLEGPKTSVVPADLVESACAEKIAEFEEKRALRKKQNHRKPRTKKSESGLIVAELELQLEALTLGTESKSNTPLNDSFPMTTSISKTTTSAIVVDVSNHDPNIAVSLNDANCKAALSSCYLGPRMTKTDVIDLLSPSPRRQPPPQSYHMISTSQQVTGKCIIDVIDLSDSETEMPSEHAKKARELRSFLASIKDDVIDLS